MNKSAADLLEWEVAGVSAEPFRYFVLSRMFDEAALSHVLGWLEAPNAWKLVTTDFYEQYEFSLWNVKLPERVAFLTEPRFQRALRKRVENTLDVSLANRVDAVAHKLMPGQRIRQHNDFIPGYETHRLTVQLNRGLDEAAGGWFVLFSGPEPADIHKVLLPRHNSALGFAISQSSFHAVSPLARGERYTLVFSFYECTPYECTPHGKAG